MTIENDFFEVALVQLTSTSDTQVNFNTIISVLKKLESASTPKLVIFPENAFYFRFDRSNKINGIELNHLFLNEISLWSEKTQCSVMITSAFKDDDNKTCNGTVLIQPGSEPKLVYKKIHLFDVNVLGAFEVRESNDFTRGIKPSIINIDNWTFGLSICYDLRFSDLYNFYGRKEVDAILVPSSFLVPTGKVHWEPLLVARAIENQAYVLAPGQGGEHRGPNGELRKTWGHSLFIDPWGKILEKIEGEQQGPILVRHKMQRNRINEVRSQIPMKNHRVLHNTFKEENS